MEEYLTRFLAFLKWVHTAMADNPERAIERFERLMADPGLERLRRLYDTPIGMLPFAPKQGDTWGVAKGDTIWACKRRTDGDVFILGDHMVGVYKHLGYELHENVIIVRYVENGTKKTVGFRFDGTTWRYHSIREGLSVVAVRADDIVLRDHDGVVMVENIATRDVTFPFGSVPIDGVQAGEDWLLVWKRHGARLVVNLMTQISQEEQLVENSKGNPEVFPRFGQDGKFVNVCVTVHADIDKDVWHHGERLSVLAHDPSRIVEKVLVIDTYSWTLLRKRGIGRPDFGIIAVNGSYRPEFDCATALTVKDGVVCVTYTNNTRPRYASDTLVICAPNGTKYAEVDQVAEPNRYDPLREWPFVRKMLPGYAFARVEKGRVTIHPVTLPGQASAHRNGEYLFVTGPIMSGGVWMTVAYHESTRVEVDGAMRWVASATTRKPVDLALVVVPRLGEMIVAMRRNDKWVTVQGSNGDEYGLDYTEVRDIRVEDGFVTFIARNDRDVVRVRAPM